MTMHEIKKKIDEHEGIRIAEKELRELVPFTDYNEYHSIVIALVESGVIAPVKASGSNGMRPPLHKRYSKIKPDVKYDDLIPEIRLLHNSLNIEGYLNDPLKYIKHKCWISILDCFLKNNLMDLQIPLSINERSFQIFRKEKVLKDNRELAAVIAFNPGLKEILNFYNTPEPFFTYNITLWENDGQDSFSLLDQPAQVSHKLNALVVENKDTWYTLRNLLSKTCCVIAGIPIDYLIYGEGKKISRKVDSLTDFDQTFLKRSGTSYYYFGDLDYEGISIAHDLICTNPSLQIEIMKPLYIAMLDAAKGIGLPLAKENQNKKALQWFNSFFDAEYRTAIRSILEDGRYIPQEILNNGDFRKMIGDNIKGGAM